MSVSILSALCCWKANRRWGMMIGCIAFLISISTLLVKQHFIADVVLGAILAYISYRLYVFPYQNDETDQLLPIKFTLIPLALFSIIVMSAYILYLQSYQPWI